MCGNQQPPQQILYNLFSTIAVTEIKGYSMIQFSYMLLKLYGKGKEAYVSIVQTIIYTFKLDFTFPF